MPPWAESPGWGVARCWVPWHTPLPAISLTGPCLQLDGEQGDLGRVGVPCTQAQRKVSGGCSLGASCPSRVSCSPCRPEGCSPEL